MNVKTAVIAVQGVGTRGFPITTAIEKCMMPIYANGQSKPFIDFIVADCAAAGIERIIFVSTQRGSIQLKEYFEDLNSLIAERLVKLGKEAAVEAEIARRKARGIKFEYVISDMSDKYGTNVPLFLARKNLKSEDHFVLMMGDDFLYHQDGTSDLALAIEAWKTSGTDHVVVGSPVERKDAPNYGILQADTQGHLDHIDEKPPLNRVPKQPVANISKYLFSKAIWLQVEEEMNKPHSLGTEYYITNAIDEAVKAGQTFYIHAAEGVYLDGGSYEGLLYASNYLTTHPPKA